jgi:hypothetical protein
VTHRRPGRNSSPPTPGDLFAVIWPAMTETR